jgi:hypothetical protein
MRLVRVVGLWMALGGAMLAQEKEFGWVRANNQVTQLDPADFRAGRVYRPGPNGGNMHIDVQAGFPVTIAMAPAAEWQAQQEHPEGQIGYELSCVREHISNMTYECPLAANRPMVLLFRDERKANRVLMTGIATVLGPNAKPFLSPNDVMVTYYNWSCVRNCLEAEFRWFSLLNEKYRLTSVPKIYSLLTPERDDQRVSIRIKAPIPMTVALLPSELADKVYDDPGALTSALASTSCKQRGVQSLNFECTVNLADGRQSLVVVPDLAKVPNKKAEIQLQTVQCSANCQLMNK